MRRPLVLIVGLLLHLAGASAPTSAAVATPRPPNIIFILADDLGYGDLGCYGQTRFKTPHLDRLAAEGLRFTSHYSGATVCAPSRSALLTGLHTGHTPVRGNLEIQPEGQHPLPAATVTLPKVLKTAGYTSGLFGKWGLGFPGSEGEPLRQGFDRFYGFNCQRLGHHYYPHHLWDDARKIILEENSGAKKGAYAPDLIHRQTLAFLAQHRDRPFFCFVASIIPHADLAAPASYHARHRGKYGPEQPYVGVDRGPEYRRGPYESQAEPRAAFAAMINLLDDQVGEIVAQVRALGPAENTLILFSSDNGPHREGGHDPDVFHSAGGLRGTKRDLYEGGIRVPLIAWWPGTIRPGTTTGHISAFWDLLPTFAELAGAPAPAGLDGLSLVPTLTGRGTQAQHNYLYWEFHEGGGRLALRQGEWKIVRYDVLKNPDGPVQLFNISRDPAEASDLAAQEPQRAQAMAKLMRSARTDSPVFRFSQTGYLQKK
ncbi:MAG: arylsulfatase [Verrucomicrobia bacterium]|nr:arylsulfatase [Verrucomicrobiota bacterium]